MVSIFVSKSGDEYGTARVLDQGTIQESLGGADRSATTILERSMKLEDAG
jgi:hypothetical protein